MIDYGYIMVGTKEELDSIPREIDFSSKKFKNVEICFNALGAEQQRMVSRVVENLTGGKEFFGYNLKQIAKLYKKPPNSLPMAKVLKCITDNSDYSEYYDTDYNDWVKYMTKLKHVKSLQKDETNRHDMIRKVCDYFLINEELLHKGEGEIYYIADKYITDKYINDDFDKFINSTFFQENKKQLWNVKLLLKKYQAYLKEIYPNHPDIIEVKYAKIKKSGAYQMLMEKADKKQLKAVQNLIGDLFACSIYF